MIRYQKVFLVSCDTWQMVTAPGSLFLNSTDDAILASGMLLMHFSKEYDSVRFFFM